MAELGITCPPASSTSSGAGNLDLEKLSLIRTGGRFAKNTALDINNPGAGWTSIGGPIVISGSTEFVEQIQTFRNGLVQLPGENSGFDYDVYFIAANGSIAFESDLHKHDVVQVWNFKTTASG
ncbi:hypothetical protein LCGC14_1702530 [marine sediment metagenome]|uniref:Uncharacterized protein n=1 Tax=marine sediment metagenome TaxID=412755 RepID=A0A0F9HH81_9ZZZZ